MANPSPNLDRRFEGTLVKSGPKRVCRVPLSSPPLSKPKRPTFCPLKANYTLPSQVTAFQLLDAKQRFMANPPPHVHDGNMREVSTLFAILHSLYFSMQLLTSDGVQQSFKYMEGKLEDNP